MFFLLRAAFWLTLVLALLPSGASQPSAKNAQISPIEAVSAAGAAVSDMSGFCERQAEACVVGAQTAVAIGQRAQAGAKMVYDFINERVVNSDSSATADNASDSDDRKPKLVSTAAPGQSTLKADDLAPAWRGPAQRPMPAREAQPRKDGKRPV